MDRSHAGQSGFCNDFAGTHLASFDPPHGIVQLHIFIDRGSVEVFSGDGKAAISDIIFPSEQSQGIELFTEGGTVTLNSLDIYQLNPAEFLI